MELSLAHRMIHLICEEQQRLLDDLPRDDDQQAFDEWSIRHEPFLSDLCLLLMVAVRHEVERTLVQLAARVTEGGQPLSWDDFEHNRTAERDALKRRNGWSRLAAKLRLESFPQWSQEMETLRLLANSYKHSPTGEPDRDLLVHLALDTEVLYASLPESDEFRRAIAKSFGLPETADYPTIARSAIAHATAFLEAVENQSIIGRRIQTFVSLNPKDFAR
jgi:hypothetical protein